jgi:hypothetical protein
MQQHPQLHTILQLTEPWLLLTELAQFQRVAKVYAHSLPSAAWAAKRTGIQTLFENSSTVELSSLPIQELALWERLAWRSRVSQEQHHVEVKRGRTAAPFCSNSAAHSGNEPLNWGTRLFGGQVLLCETCVNALTLSGTHALVTLLGLSQNSIRRRFPRIAYQPTLGRSKAMIYPLDLITADMVGQALGSSRTLRKLAVPGGPNQLEYPRTVHHNTADQIRRLQRHPTIGPLMQVDASKGDGLDLLELRLGPNQEETRSLRASERADLEQMQTYVTARLNLPLDTVNSETWMTATIDALLDRLEARSPALVQDDSRARIRAALYGLLQFKLLGFRFAWHSSDCVFLPNRWGYITQLLCIFLGLPQGGCSGHQAAAIMYGAPNKSQFRWVVPASKATRKRKRKA